MGSLKERIKDFFRYHNLLNELVIKDIKLKYRRSFLGYLWSVLNPLLTMLIMLLVFENIFRFEIENYAVYLIIGQTLFNFTSESTSSALTSIQDNAALIKKHMYPNIFLVCPVLSVH